MGFGAVASFLYVWCHRHDRVIPTYSVGVP